MNERNIQDYLFASPEVLFPSGNVTEKAREYSIQGKRIDLLFVVDGIRYIVEIKNVPIQREHIGQVVEYYGLMRQYMRDANLAMILVSSSIPAWRAAYLEELGIRCVEIPSVPTTVEEVRRIQKEAQTSNKKSKEKKEVDAVLGENEGIRFEDIAGFATPRGMAFARRSLSESLEPLRKACDGYEIIPFGIRRTGSHDYDLEHDATSNHGTEEFRQGGIWWAYRFGFSDDLPRNDVPNISVIANSTGLDVVLNAELQPSQRVLLERIQRNPSGFDAILAKHGNLWLKTYLKYEHQPRFYHWILAELKPPGSYDGKAIIEMRESHDRGFERERNFWIGKVISGHCGITDAQINHLQSHNRKLNLAIRLVQPFRKNAPLWAMDRGRQLSELVNAVKSLKPMIDFFVR
jgi:hypothetical protein